MPDVEVVPTAPAADIAEALDEVRKAVAGLQEAKVRVEEARLDRERREKERVQHERAARVAQVAAARRAARAQAVEIDAAETPGKEAPVSTAESQASPSTTLRAAQEEDAMRECAAAEEDLHKATSRVAAAVNAARKAGAGAAELLEASKPKAVDVEDVGAGVAARRARKLRQQQKTEAERLAKEKLERERAERVAQAAAARREKVRSAGDAVGEPVDQRDSKMFGLAPGTDERPNEGDNAEPDGGRTHLQFTGPRFGGGSALAVEEKSAYELLADTAGRPRSRSRSIGRSRSRRRRRGRSRSGSTTKGAIKTYGENNLPKGLQFDTLIAEKEQNLAALLWRTPAPVVAEQNGSTTTQYASVEDIPVAVLMGAEAASKGVARFASDLSTGGGEVCKHFRQGRCLKGSACKFRHIHRM